MWVPYNHSVFGGFRLCDWVMFLDSRWYSLMFIDFRHDFDRRGGSYFRPPDEMSVHNPNSVPDEMCIVTLHPPPVRRDVSAQRQLCRTKCVCPVSAVPSEACCAQRNVNSHDAPPPVQRDMHAQCQPLRLTKCVFPHRITHPLGEVCILMQVRFSRYLEHMFARWSINSKSI